MAGSENNGFWVGFDLGGTKMMAVVFDGKLKQKGRKRRRTRAYEGMKAGFDRIMSTIGSTVEEAGLHASDLAGIGIGAPGPLDLRNGTLVDTPNLGWKDAPLREAVHKAFGCPVVLVNDVDAGVYGEYVAGAAQGARCAVGVFPGTGIGGGCVYQGRILTGGTYSGFEIGHLQVLPNGPLCGCGRHGCLEAVASRLAVSAAVAAAAYRGEAPHLLEAAGMDLTNIRSNAIAQAIAAGDKVVETIVEDAAAWLGVGMAAVVNLLLPDVIVLGGGLVEAMPDRFVAAAEKSMRDHVMPPFRKSCRVSPAALGDLATAIGAAAWARDSAAADSAGPAAGGQGRQDRAR